MGSNRRRRSWYTLWLALGLLLYLFFTSLSSVHSYDNFAGEYLDDLLQDLALTALVQHRSHTGVVQKVTLPANLSGMEASVVRLRSRTLWSLGSNVTHFHIPPGSLPMPHVRRIVLVFQDLGNWSSHHYNVPGYSLLTSVVGFMVYSAPAPNSSFKDFTKLGINTMGNTISIHFPNFTVPEGTTCANFNGTGTVYLSDMSFPNVCYSTSEGHFAMVAPLKRKQRVWDWDFWVVRFMVGFLGLLFVTIVGVVLLVKLLKEKKIHEMERQADEDVVLETIWLGATKMPSATVTRTHPDLENY